MGSVTSCVNYDRRRILRTVRTSCNCRPVSLSSSDGSSSRSGSVALVSGVKRRRDDFGGVRRGSFMGGFVRDLGRLRIGVFGSEFFLSGARSAVTGRLRVSRVAMSEVRGGVIRGLEGRCRGRL